MTRDEVEQIKRSANKYLFATVGCEREHGECVQDLLVLVREVEQQRHALDRLQRENARLREALKNLLAENEDYIRLNNLSAMKNVNLVNARHALKETP